jgi:small subunit ribosomal protein S4
MSPYALRLLEKQKLRFNYNITERQLLRYVIQAKKSTGSG